MRKSRPTLKDIAAELNLSHPTVSRALADHDSISRDTKERIRAVADRLGYVANSSARMLRVGTGNVVGVLLPDMTNEFYAAAAQRLADDCSARNQRLLLSISGGDPERELALVRALIEARPIGLVVALTEAPRPETLEYLRGVHCVQFMNIAPGLQGPSVSVTDSGGATLAVQHLLDLGHRRIGFVGPLPSERIGEARLRGLNVALKTAGHQLDSDLIRLGPSTAEFGASAVAALLALPKPPTALYLSSAPLSLGGMHMLGERRVAIPGDISVVVAGSANWYAVWPGGLTSITLPMTDLADAASTMLTNPEAMAQQHTELSFQLIQRGSTVPFANGRT
ncbi:LacI family DNA-binding transcriptional regulator [Sphingopyxis sp. GC21]|uniref:LacI family DNA-binding transcriptional regulator n=1 Tax=Sphingopyxis sp. GC21 TaxID=2933562 RepID=UPI0021E435F6|nr:LacI family DNA-binding transcriptional regulator [Sphingopyxis sp. GC21]